MTGTAETTTVRACPRCGGALTQAGPAGTLTCGGCGHAVPAAALEELDRLHAWADWAQARAGWLKDRLVAGDLPAEGWSVGALAEPELGPPAGGGRPAPAAPTVAAPRPSAGTLLLVGGAALLVLAGIAFVAFAWDLLGPFGQLATLYALGVVAIAAGLRLRTRLAGTATTLGVVGVLLVAVSTVATRVLAGEVVGETVALVASLAAATALTWAGIVLRARQRGVGELAAFVGAGLLVVLIALAPLGDAVPLGQRWAWWSAAALLVGGVALVLLGHVWAVRSWPPLAGAALGVGSFVLAGWAADTVANSDLGEELAAPSAALVLLGVAAVEWLLARRLPWHPSAPMWASAAAWLAATAAALLSGLAIADARALAATALLVCAGSLFGTRTRLTLPRPLVDAGAAGLLGAALGLAVAPWSDAWAPWRGPLAGLVLGGLLVVLAELGRRSRPDDGRPDVAALAGGIGGLGTWGVAVLATFGEQPQIPEDVRLGIAVALVLVAVAGWAEALRRHLLAWSVWVPAALLGAAVLLLLDLTGVQTDWAPEVVGLCLGAVAAAAGTLTWWLRRPAPTSSLVVVGPALTLLLAPTTWAMAAAAVERWAGLATDASADTVYQVRVVALFVAGAGLVAFGAWRRLSGVVLPAAAALVVVAAVQLVDLGRFLPQWVSFGVAGGLLVLAGARWEAVRSLGREGNRWLHALR